MKSAYPIHVAVSVVELALWVLSHSTLHCNTLNWLHKNYSGQQCAKAGIQLVDLTGFPPSRERRMRLISVSLILLCHKHETVAKSQVPSPSRGRVGWGWVENAGEIHTHPHPNPLLEGEGASVVLVISVCDTVRLTDVPFSPVPEKLKLIPDVRQRLRVALMQTVTPHTMKNPPGVAGGVGLELGSNLSLAV